MLRWSSIAWIGICVRQCAMNSQLASLAALAAELRRALGALIRSASRPKPMTVS
jgi:hypothetical protein